MQTTMIRLCLQLIRYWLAKKFHEYHVCSLAAIGVELLINVDDRVAPKIRYNLN